MRRNRLVGGLIYCQVTRGVARRDFAFPPPGTRPSLVMTARRTPPYPASPERWTAEAVTLPDQRWARRDIKSVALLPNVLARQSAREQGAAEAILYDGQDMVTEGAASSVWIVDENGTLCTRPLSRAILPGCTRAALAAMLSGEGIVLQERAFSRDELARAGEVFLTSATSFVKPVLKIDGVAVGDGAPGPVSRLLFDMFARHVLADA